MKVLVPVLASLFVSTVAFAQPGEPMPPEPAPSTAPPPAAPPPAAPPPAAPPPAAMPAPAYAPVPVPGYTVAGPWAFHRGVTFEANLGVGWVHESASFMGASASADSDAALAGADISIGGWINPQLALTLRIAGLEDSNTMNGVTSPADGEIVHGFVGPNVQYWLTPEVWIGGGAGLSFLEWVNHSDTDCTGSNCGTTGFGFNLRAGYTYPLGGANTLNFSVETNTGFYSQDDGMGNTESLTLTGISFLAGYQYL